MLYNVQNLQDYCIYAGHFLAYRKWKSYVNCFLGKWSNFARKLGIAGTFLAICRNFHRVARICSFQKKDNKHSALQKELRIFL